MKRVYKWFRRTPHGTLRPLVIQSAEGPFYLLYREGEWTEPPKQYPQAWIFCFTSKRKALHQNYDAELWECEARETMRAFITSGPWKGSMESFWDNFEEAQKFYEPRWDDDVLCNGIKPVRRIA